MVKSGSGLRIWMVSGAMLSTGLIALPSFFYFPPMDGWSNFPLGQVGQFPYRDFFYPVTPFTYWEAQFARLFEDPVLGLRLSAIWLPFVWAVANIKMMNKLVPPLASVILTVLLAACIVSLRLEAYVGWNTQFILALSAGYSFTFLGLNACQDSTSPFSKQLRYSLAAGAFYSIAFLVKQTAIVTIGLSFFAFAVFVLIYAQRALLLSIIRLMGYTWGVMGLSALGLVVYLSGNNALGAFADDMSMSGGKNPTVLKGISWATSSLETILLNPETLVLVAFALISLLVAISSRKSLTPNATSQPYVYLPLLIFTSTWLYLPANVASLVPKLLASLTLGYLLARLMIRFRNRVIVPTLFAFIAGFGPFLLGWILSKQSFLQFISDRFAFNTLLVELSVVAFIAVFVYALVNIRAERSKLTRDSTLKFEKSPFYLGFVFMAVSGLGSLINVLSSGGGFYLQWFIPQFALLIGCGIKYLRSRDNTKTFEKVVIGLTVISTASLIAVTAKSPYIWFGWQEQSILSGPRTLATFPYLQSTYLSPKSYRFYSELAQFIQVADGLGAPELVGKNSLFAFPNMPAAYAITNTRIYSESVCAVHWFDVCPNELSKIDLVNFKANPAQIIVWNEIPTDLVFANEQNFLGSDSAWRAWDAYRIEQLQSGKWTLVGAIDADGSTPNSYRVDIYRTIG